MRGIIRIILLLAIVGIFITMIQAGDSSTYVGGAAVILLLVWLFRKIGGSSRSRKQSGRRSGGTRNVRYNDQPSAPALPSYSEIMQIINDYVGYYATAFDCNITPSHIYITVNFAPGTSVPLAQQRVNDLCNEICNTYGISVSVNR